MPTKVWAAFSPGLVPPAEGRAKGLAYAATWLGLLALGGAGAWIARTRLRPYALLLAAPYLSVLPIAALFWGQTRLRVDDTSGTIFLLSS